MKYGSTLASFDTHGCALEGFDASVGSVPVTRWHRVRERKVNLKDAFTCFLEALNGTCLFLCLKTRAPWTFAFKNAEISFEIRTCSGMFAKPLTQIQICHVSMEQFVIIRRDTKKRCNRWLPSFHLSVFRSKVLGT